MSGNQRFLHWWESQVDAPLIQKNGWRFNIAKVVTDGNGVPTSNVIWQSAGLAPMVNIEWETDYALNWCAKLPRAGATVTVGGRWQKCNKGEAYDLDEFGFWVPSQSSGDAGWLTVGNVGYKYPGVNGICIVVGVKNADTGGWDTIYIDPTSLPPGSNAAYQPQETVKWWLAGGTSSGSVYTKTSGAVDIKDYTAPAPTTGKYEYWTTYTFATGSWQDSQTKPPNTLMAPMSVDVNYLTLFRYVLFTIPVEVGLQGFTTAYLRAELGPIYGQVSFKWLTLTELEISFGAAGLADMDSNLGGSDTIDNDIDRGLRGALSEHDLPSGETWIIQNYQAFEEAKDNEAMTNGATQQPAPAIAPAGRQARKPAAIMGAGSNFQSQGLPQRAISGAPSITAF